MANKVSKKVKKGNADHGLPNQEHALMTDEEVASFFQVHRATIWRRVKDGSFPQPIRIGGITRWPRSEIIEAIEAAKQRR